jgi:predicted dienelactone hydrolase
MRTGVVRGLTLLAFLACSLLLRPADSAASQPERLGKFDVGYTRFRMNLVGAVGEARPVDVEVWYPAKKKHFEKAPPAVYRSRFHGVTLIPSKWDPLAWELVSAIARAGAPIDDKGPAFPVVVFSHGSGASPLDFIKNLEHLASHGYVVAAPWHTRHNQDEARANFVNVQNGGPRFMPCMDGRLIPCMETNATNLAINRTRDVSGALDALPGLFGSRVDTDRVGAMGHSSGGLTVVAAAAGSTTLGIPRDPRVKSVLPLASGPGNVVLPDLDLQNVTVPMLLMVGDLDLAAPPEVSLQIFNGVASTDKAFVLLRDTTHRTLNSSFCDQMQASGAATLANPVRGILDRHTLNNTLALANPENGSTLDYCTHGD